MTPAPDLTPLLPDDATRQARREALVAELESGTAAGATDPVRRTNRRTLLRTGSPSRRSPPSRWPPRP